MKKVESNKKRNYKRVIILACSTMAFIGILFVFFHHTDDKTYSVFVPDEKEQGKTVLYLAGVNVSEDVRTVVDRFNKTQDECTIKIKSYDEDDVRHSYAKMNTDVMAGNRPDIYYLDDTNRYIYQNSSLLELINPLLDNDDSFSKDDYFSSQLFMYQNENEIYDIVPYFYIVGTVGKEKELKELDTFTIEDISKLLANKKTDTYPYAENDKIIFSELVKNQQYDMLKQMKIGEMDDFSQSYEQYVVFAKECGRRSKNGIPLKNHKEVKDGRLLFEMDQNIGVLSVEYYDKFFGENCYIVGYPDEGFCGPAMRADYSLGMSSDSKHKDEVWLFMKMFLEDEYQASVDYCNNQTPVKKSAYDAMIDRLMQKENILLENGIERVPYYEERGHNDYTTELGPITKQEGDRFLDTINRVDHVYSFDIDVMDIMDEEAYRYFDDEQDIKQAKKRTISRLQTYLNEWR